MSSENKGTDQLCSYCTADLRLYFRVGKNLVLSCYNSLINIIIGFIPVSLFEIVTFT